MRRLLLGLILALATSPLLAADCAPAAACTPGPCLASSAASWSCGHVPNLGTDTLTFAGGELVTLDTNLDILGGNGSTTGFISGQLVSDGNTRSITMRCSAGNQGLTLTGFAGGQNGKLDLKGHDSMIAIAVSNQDCRINFASNAKFWNEGTIGSEQTTATGSISNVGTTYTISGITTTGFAVGDILWWTSGAAARDHPYEITALTASTVTYQTDLPDGSSAGLNLTPDEQTVGGPPSIKATTPSVLPVAGDKFRLIAPVKWRDGSGGGAWVINNTQALVASGTDIIMDGFSYVSTNLGAQKVPFGVRFPVSGYTGTRRFRYMNLGEHRAQSPFSIRGQGFAVDHAYCHDSLSGSTSTGACLDMQQCPGGAECSGVAYVLKDIFVDGFIGTHTTSQPMQIGNAADATPNTNIVVWNPSLHDGGASDGVTDIESNGIEISSCDGCLVYGGSCWNIIDPNGDGGNCYAFSKGTGSIIADSYALNSGTGIYLANWDAVNVYVSNMAYDDVTCEAPLTVGSGTVYNSILANWSMTATTHAAVHNCNMEGVAAIGTSSSQVNSKVWDANADPSDALTIRNVLMKNYKNSAILPASTLDQNLTIEHVTCAGPASGSQRCVDLSAVTAAVTLTVDNVLGGSCGTSAANVVACAGAGPTDNLDEIARDSDVCGAVTGTCSANTNETSASDPGFTDFSNSNYNLLTSSAFYRTGSQPALSSNGVRCTGFDASRMPPGLTMDTTAVAIATEVCIDPDRDGYMTFPLGTNSPDSCDYVTDLHNAGTCANGETAPGKRVFP